MPYAFNPFTGNLDYFETVTPADLTRVNDTNVTLTLGGTPTGSLLQAVSITAGWAGQLSVGRGGTALSTIASGSILAANTLDTLSAITSTSGLKVLKNNAGTISWNTTTGTGDSVMATSPTFVTDLTTPLVYGSSSASGNLLLQSTSNSTRGFVQVEDLAQFGAATHAFAATSTPYMDIATGNCTVTTGAITGIRFQPTITVGGNSASTLAALFNNQLTVKDDATGRTVGPSLVFASQNTYTATVAGGLTCNDLLGIPAYTGLYFVGTLNRTGAGTGTLATAAAVHLSNLWSIGTGWTVTNLIGLLVDFPGTLTGTLTNFYGVKNNANSGTNRWFLHSAGTAQNYLAGKLGLGIAVPLSALHIEGATGGWILQDEQDSNPTTTELDANDSIAIYNKANKLVFAYNNAGTITYLSIPLDGSTTTWTHSTTAP